MATLSVADTITLLGAHDGHRASDQDNGTTPNTNFYGFLRGDGSWYIIKEVTDGNLISQRYAKGASDYVTNWTGRAGLEYDYFSVVFPQVASV